MIPQLEIIIIASVVASACVLPGVFLVLRGVALMSDAISHSILLGIVLGFFAVHSLHSPLLILAATLAGVLTVSLTELLINTQRLKKDAAIGLVFPVFFSIGVIMISKYAGQIHLDTDAVLLGELAFAPFNRLLIQSVDLGPQALWVMGTILILNIAFISLWYKELKLSTFDAGLATSLGFSPVFIHYGLMTITSITAVGAFDAVGSILVVALMIAPPSAAYLLTHRLSTMIFYSLGIGLLSAILGYGLAHQLNASIAGSMATMTGLFFLAALLFSPSQGLVSKLFRIKSQRIDFAVKMLTVQLLAHEGTKAEDTENSLGNLVHHMGWKLPFAKRVSAKAVRRGYITRNKNHFYLTNLGREIAKVSIINP